MFSAITQKEFQKRYLVFFILLLVAINLLVGLVLIPSELIQIDSGGYIDFSSSRTIGYPVFLWCIHALFKTYAVVPFFQLLIYSFASYRLAVSIKNICKNTAISYFLLSLLWLNPVWMKYHFQIMTESLSVSLLCLFMASLINAHLKGNYKSFLYAGIFFALGVSVRPINLYYLPILMGALYFFWKKHRNFLLKDVVVLTMAPFFLYAISSATNSYVHRDAKSPSFFGHILLGKVGFFATPDVKTTEPQFMRQLSEHTCEFREMINQNKSIQNYYQFTASYTDMIRYGVLGKIPLTQNQLEDRSFYTKRAFEIIKHYPALYAKDVGIQLSALWLMMDIKMPSEKNSMTEFVERFFVLKNSDIRAEIYFNKRVRPAWQAIFVRLIFGVLFLLTLFCLFIPLLRPQIIDDTFYFSFTLASYMVQLGFLCIALCHEGFPRFAMSLWPALFVPVCLVSDHLLCLIKRHRC